MGDTTLLWECGKCGATKEFLWRGLPPGPIVCEICVKKMATTERPPAVSVSLEEGESVPVVGVKGEF